MYLARSRFGGFRLQWRDSEYGPVVGCCEHGNEPSGFTKDSGFLNWLSDSTLEDFVLKLGRVVFWNTPQFYELKNHHFWFWWMRTSHAATPSCYVLLRLTVMTCLKQHAANGGRVRPVRPAVTPEGYCSHKPLPVSHPLTVRVRLMPGMPYLQRTGIQTLRAFSRTRYVCLL